MLYILIKLHGIKKLLQTLYILVKHLTLLHKDMCLSCVCEFYYIKHFIKRTLLFTFRNKYSNFFSVFILDYHFSSFVKSLKKNLCEIICNKWQKFICIDSKPSKKNVSFFELTFEYFKLFISRYHF